jgi:cytochrome c2
VLFHAPTSRELLARNRLREGRDLFVENMCNRCHQYELSGSVPERGRDAPKLTDVTNRLNGDWLAAWVADPKQLAPDALMPSVLPPSDRRANQIADLIAYFKSTAPAATAAPEEPSDEELIATGEEHFERIGCIACHTFEPPTEQDSYGRRSLYFTKARFRPGKLVEFLRRPHQDYVWNRMPDFHLNADEAASLAAFIRGKSTGVVESPAHAGEGDPQRGHALYKSAGCIHCHTEGAVAPPEMPPILGKNHPRGCLGSTAEHRGKAPVFEFSKEECESLSEFLAASYPGTKLADTSTEASRRLMKHFRCHACHSRDGVGGDLVKIVLDEGSTGLLPDRVPDLTLTGEKLRTDWVERLLQGKLDYRSRSWFDARMPAFPVAAAAIAHGLAAEHGLPPDEPPFSPDPRLIPIGKRLSEKNGGLDCRQCHNLEAVTPKQVNDAQGISFLHVPERIRHGYYSRWMLDPLRIDPATKMPKFAADGRHTVVKDVFDGDAGRQFESIWHYLQSRPATAEITPSRR